MDPPSHEIEVFPWSSNWPAFPQLHFLRYHAQADGAHTGRLDTMLTSGRVVDQSDAIVTCAKVVARLYALQLEELDQV